MPDEEEAEEAKLLLEKQITDTELKARKKAFKTKLASYTKMQ